MTRDELREYQRGLIRAFVQAQHFTGKQVLDYGCGAAPYRDLIEAQGGTWSGYNRGRYPGGARVEIGEDDCLHQHWDVILCTQVLQYVPEPYETLFLLGHALKKKQGTLVLTYQTNWPEVEPEDLWRFTKMGMEVLLHGWTIHTHEQLGSVLMSDSELAALGYGLAATPLMDVLLAPHNDDETLFATYACLAHKPLVVVVLRSFVEETWPDGPIYQTREDETQAACDVLGVNYVQWEYPDDNPPWLEIEAEIIALKTESVFAPLPEPGGHPHHNEIGAMAVQRFKHVRLYSTYTHEFGKTTSGTLVHPEPGWEARKREAMACYPSQSGHPYCEVAWHEWPIDEYLT